MDVTVEVVGEDTRDVAVSEGATYADVLEAIGESPHQVSVLVDGRHVPVDQSVESDSVQVVRLVKGG